MQTPIITDESLSQMSLMRLTSYTLSLLAEALPHITNVETAESNAQASATAAAATVNGFDAHVVEKMTEFYDQADSKNREFNTNVAKANEQINNAIVNGLDRINAAIATVLTTEV